MPLEAETGRLADLVLGLVQVSVVIVIRAYLVILLAFDFEHGVGDDFKQAPRSHVFRLVDAARRVEELLRRAFHFRPLGVLDRLGHFVRAWAWVLLLGDPPCA